MAKTLQGYALLTFTAILWGTGFIFQKNSTDYLDAFSFNTARFIVAVAALLLLKALPASLFAPEIEADTTSRRWFHSALIVGAGAGVFMFAGITLQQVGLAYTTAGKSGFLTSLYIVVIPILGLAFGQRPKIEVWIGALLALGGVYLLGSASSSDVESQFNRGDVFTLLCALAWAAQVMWLGAYARHTNVLTVATVQMAVVAALSAIAMVIYTSLGYSEPATMSDFFQVRNDLFYTGVISAAVGFTLQILGQRHVPATNAALIMSTESVFALLAGVLLLGEPTTLTSVMGCTLILGGIVLAQLQGRILR